MLPAELINKPTMQGNGLDIENWDKPIYRIYSMERFIDLVKTGANGLVHPSMWDDPFENFFLKCVAIDEGGNRISLESIAAGWYGQCWTTNRDSDAMWRIYSHNKNGIRVATTIRKLFESFYDPSDISAALKYFIGTVRYVERAEIEQLIARTSFTSLVFGGQSDKFARTLCIKRPEFAHENEIRLLFHDVKNNKGENQVAKFPLDISKVASEIALDPRLSAAEFESVKQQLVESGCSLPICQSDLYQINEMTIRL